MTGQLTQIPCIFCQHYHSRVLIQENGYQGVKCDSCGLIYISPRPAWPDILALYLKTGEKENLQKSTRAGKLSILVKSLPARQTLAILKKFRLSGTLLELGPGTGEFLSTLKTAGFEVYGLEVNQKRAEYIRQTLGIPCDSTPLNSSPWAGRKFDIVYLRDVLSHFFDPIAEFRLIHQIVNANGLLVFETGNLGDVEEKYFQIIPTFDYPEHLFFFGETSLRLLLESTGFELVEIRPYAVGLVLRLEKIVHCLRKHNKPAADTVKIPRSETAARTNSRGLKKFIKEFLLLSYDFFVEYFLKYQLGRYLPKSGQPQTLIVIARKK
jgi:SAM-dependent methyltransferase